MFLVEIAYECSGLLIKLKEKKMSEKFAVEVLEVYKVEPMLVKQVL